MPGIGVCLIRNLCLLDHEKFKVLQLNVLMGDSWGFAGVQLGAFRNRTYGPTGLQLAFANQSGVDVPAAVQVGIYNMMNDGGFTLLQIGIFANLSHRDTTVAGLQLSGVLNLEDRGAAGPTVYGVQLSGGLNRAANVYGLQLGLDIHWLFAIFFEDRKEYYSSAENVYGLKVALITGAVREHMVGLQLGLLTNTKTLWGVQLGLGNTITERGLGLQVGIFDQSARYDGAMIGIANSATGDVRGVQFGLYNNAGSIVPLQLGLVNTTQMLAGVQLGLGNHADREAIGFQCCGFNTARVRLLGGQLGLYNRAHSAYFQVAGVNSSVENPVLQLGALNMSENDSTGVQVGVFNYTSGKATLQIGLLNFAGKNFLPFFPIINLNLDEGGNASLDLDREMALAARESALE